MNQSSILEQVIKQLKEQYLDKQQGVPLLHLANLVVNLKALVKELEEPVQLPAPVQHKPCKGTNCGITNSHQQHSVECIAEHNAACEPMNTAGNRHPEYRYAGYKNQPLKDGCTKDQEAAYLEGKRAQQPAHPVSGFGLAAVGQKHFGNPIPKAWYAAARELMAQQPAQQEPVTDEENEKFSRDVSNFKGADPEATKYALEEFLKNRTTPQPAPRREWIGLTEKEYSKLWVTHNNWLELCRAIEAELEEKNT